ncbi:MAG: YHYH protein, partial [Acidimicrobiales bacterium]|nr:YHYH protein [Acidimicrobiales bacterium]
MIAPGSRLLALALVGALVVAACGSSDDGAGGTTTTTDAASPSTTAAAASEPVTVAELFDPDALAAEVTEVDCTLENGSTTSCHRLVVASIPGTVDPGPFCPPTVDSDEGGIFTWDGDDPGLYALDASFWSLMDQQGYSFADADGSLHIADPADAAPGQDSCLEATPDDSYTLAVLLPTAPEDLDEPTDLGTVSQVGLALDGVTIFGDAPSGTSGAIPALDPCGGHVDPSGYYHWHFGATSIQSNLDAAGVPRECGEPQDEDAIFGVAFDGYAIYGPHHDGTDPTDLDECSGHVA